ncbi:DUF4432 family protein [Streptomyces sp. NPDC001732]
MNDLLTLETAHLKAQVDVGRGSDVLSLIHRDSGHELLFSTPWRDRADAVRAGTRQPAASPESFSGWLEQYRGGWQTLCPNAGDPRLVAGAPVGFHGEASIVRWEVLSTTRSSARLRTELFSVPVTIDREVVLDRESAKLSVTDLLSNTSDVPLEIDCVSHPAFAGPLLDGASQIDTGARRFTADPMTPSKLVEPGSSHDWPLIRTPDGSDIDLRSVPQPGERRALLGWLSDFDTPWASITNQDLGLTVRIDWNGTHQPYAWLWQELQGTDTFPWYGRARVVAIEPASSPTGGPGRRSALRLAPRQQVSLSVSVSAFRLHADTR